CAFLYAWLVVCAGVSFSLALTKGLPMKSVYFYLPVLITSLILASLMLKGAYKERRLLERMCALTILVNLGTSLSCILGLLMGRIW
ncbi:MAG: hypothetical protein PHR73_06595, partial [Candidatus Omnitrophica bacterium]|nr:hypothetical protein [Candidatus Omnitrophota bacterium]